MEKKSPNDFDKFEELARSIVNVPHSVVKKKLDEEKQNRAKRKRARKGASREVSGST